jgi:hypothetical protein
MPSFEIPPWCGHSPTNKEGFASDETMHYLEHGHLPEQVPLIELLDVLAGSVHVDVHHPRDHHPRKRGLLVLAEQTLPRLDGVQHHPFRQQVHLLPCEALPVPEGRIQGTFREHSGNIQGTFREHSGNI